MAISANAVFEVQSGASDLNGGAFTSTASGEDRSQQTAPHVTIDGATISAVVDTTTTDLVLTGYTVDEGSDPGNYVRVSGGTATAGLYEIISANEGNNSWRLDRSAGTAAQTATGRMGGALATPGQAGTDATVSGNKIWWKAFTSTLSTSTPGSGGPVLFASAVNVELEAYSVTRGDQAALGVLDAGAQTGINLFAGQGSGRQSFVCCKADGQAGANNVGFDLANDRHTAFLCDAFDCVNGFFRSGARPSCLACLADTCSTAGFSGLNADFCRAKSCGIGFNGITNTGLTFANCLAYLCTTDGFVCGQTGQLYINCTADDNGSNGFNLGSGQAARAINCLATNHDGVGDAGFLVAGTVNSSLINCAGFNNTDNASGTFFRNQGFIALTADPYQSQAGADYQLNNSVGGGLLLQSAGIGVYGQTNRVDVGAVRRVQGAGVGRQTILQGIGTY